MWGVRMNWEAIGAIGEITGATGVIISVAYLAIQIRKNTASLNADITMSYINSHLHALAPGSESKESARVLRVGGTIPPLWTRTRQFSFTT